MKKKKKVPLYLTLKPLQLIAEAVATSENVGAPSACVRVCVCLCVWVGL
jgi:hypothetical protein